MCVHVLFNLYPNHSLTSFELNGKFIRYVTYNCCVMFCALSCTTVLLLLLPLAIFYGPDRSVAPRSRRRQPERTGLGPVKRFRVGDAPGFGTGKHLGELWINRPGGDAPRTGKTMDSHDFAQRDSTMVQEYHRRLPLHMLTHEAAS